MRAINNNRRLIIAAIGLVMFGALMIALFEKQSIIAALEPGEKIEAEFPRDYKLVPNSSQVKIAGTPVGTVTKVEPTNHGTFRVSMNIDGNDAEKLGTKPSASIRPITVLGGKYYIALRSGGSGGPFTDGTIPMERTETPVELDTLLRAVPPQVQASVRNVPGKLDDALTASRQPLRDMLGQAPDTLRPSGDVLEAVRGTRPDADLKSMVTDMHAVTSVMTRQDGQLANIVDSLHNTTKTLADQSGPLTDTVSSLPETLRATRTGSTALGGTLDKVTATAGSARKLAHELDPALRKLDPVLADTRPVLHDLRPTLEHARPVVDQLNPVAQQGTAVLNDVKGPVLDRINGPILNTLTSEWKGVGPKYPNGGGNGHKYYEELGYLIALLSGHMKHFDTTGSFIPLQFGAGINSVANTPLGLNELLENLNGRTGPPAPQPVPPVDLTPLLPGASEQGQQKDGGR